MKVSDQDQVQGHENDEVAFYYGSRLTLPPQIVRFTLRYDTVYLTCGKS